MLKHPAAGALSFLQKIIPPGNIEAMRKPIVPRFIALFFLYTAVFIILVQIQFNKPDFTERAGDLVIQGRYARNRNREPGSFFLSGSGVSVFFGGMEFLLREGFVLSGAGGERTARPAVMTITDNEVSFRLAEGPELIFTTQYTGGAIELVIRSDFSIDDALHTPPEFWQSMRIPFRALATSLLQERDASLLVNANGVNYTFNRLAGSPAAGNMAVTAANSIVLAPHSPVISYRALPDKETADPKVFILPMAQYPEQYESALALWLDQSYSAWSRAVSMNVEDTEIVNGDFIRAYMSEALKRGTYKSAAASVSRNTVDLPWEAAAYVGRLDAVLRNLASAERERSARLARLLNEKSLEFLREFHVIQYLAARGYNNLMDDAAKILRTLDPAVMSVEQAAGFLEGALDWARYHPGKYNPYDRFVDQALFVVTESLQKDPYTAYALAFSKTSQTADMELNLRLGNALLQYNDETKIALGRTLILSVLSLGDNSGAVPGKVTLNIGGFTGNGEFLSSSRIYRICFTGENYARAQTLGSGLWAWTAASSVSCEAAEGRQDITAAFPAGETHYMIIRGVKPFTLLQFNGITTNQDLQFERYDNSGWVYSAPEQTLLVKLRQRLPAERISLVY
jgi:hypothetical protein